jgi:predicted permease
LKDPASLVSFDGSNAKGQRQRLFSYLDYLDYRQQNQSLSDVIAWNKVRATLGEAPPTQDDSSAFAEGYEFLFGQIVTTNYFSELGAEMSLGRGFQPDDESVDHPVVVLSHGCWGRRFLSDPSIVGKTIMLQGQNFTIVGVTGKDFVGTTPDVPAFWTPLGNRDLIIQNGGWAHKIWRTDRNTAVLTLLGRLKSGVSSTAAESDLRLIANRLAQTFPAHERVTNISLQSAATFVTLNEELMQLVVPLLLGFALVLIIACANVANLLLARSAGRHREIALRLAVGANRSRIIRQLITESVLLAFAGGVIGLLLAVWTLSALYPLVLSAVPLPEGLATGFSLNLTPDLRVFGFTFLIATIAGVGAGLLPAVQVSKPNLSFALKGDGATTGRDTSQSRLRSGFVMVQIAVCMALLACAGLLVRNLQRVKTIDTGMSTRNVFSVAIGVHTAAKDETRVTELRGELAQRLRAMPGVVTVSEARQQPLSGSIGNTLVMLPGGNMDHPLEARFNSVSAEYFNGLSIPIVQGRGFTQQEVIARTPVIVISKATAAHYWPGVNPIGQHIGVSASEQSTTKTDERKITYRQYEVIGVAGDTRSRWVWQKDETLLYLPLSPATTNGSYLLVTTETDPKSIMDSVRGLAASVNPDLRVSSRLIDADLAFQMAPFRAIAWLSGVLGLLAMLLASVGLYGVMSFVVTERTREIGIRVALGAEPRTVIKMFIVQGLRLTVFGIALGIAGGALISRLLASALVDLNSFDLLAFSSVSAFLATVALLAVLIPASRAAKVDPLVALRYE